MLKYLHWNGGKNRICNAYDSLRFFGRQVYNIHFIILGILRDVKKITH
jgi:hypothetical protein